MRSFSRPPPRESCLTRAVAVEGTSTTSSPRAISQEVRCRPRPSAFSIAHRRCGHRAAHVSIRRYSRKLASMRIDATSRFVPGSTAVAVWVVLCGSIPISIIVGGSLSVTSTGDPRLTTRLRETAHQCLVVTPLLSQAANGRRPGRHTQREPAFGRKYSSQPAPASYGHATGSKPDHDTVHHIQVGKYWRRMPFVFSLVPRCQGACGSQK